MSMVPLSEVFLRKEPVSVEKTVVSSLLDASNIKDEVSTETACERTSVKVINNKANGEVVYAEADEDFIDLLFSFLTLPLSSLIKFCRKGIRLRCLNNLYESIEILSNGEIRLMSEDGKTMFLDSKLAPTFQHKQPGFGNRCSNGRIKYRENPKLPNKEQNL